MAKFGIGDRVRMIGVPIVVEVLEFDTCPDATPEYGMCDFGGELFRFRDPQTGESDWMHTSDFERVE